MVDGRLLALALYTSLPVLATTTGAVIATIIVPAAGMRSRLQHFAAGVVFSVVAVELLPDVTRAHAIREVVTGFALGVMLMLVVRYSADAAARRVIRDSGSEARSNSDPVAPTSISRGMLTSIGIDVLIDGILVGIAFTAGSKEGVMLALALTVELLSLGLAIASELTSVGATRVRTIVLPFCLSLLLPLGTVAGTTLLRGASSHLLAGVLAFGSAALLFLVTEELLVEAHDVPETASATTAFFAGFLLFLVFGMVG